MNLVSPCHPARLLLAVDRQAHLASLSTCLSCPRRQWTVDGPHCLLHRAPPPQSCGVVCPQSSYCPAFPHDKN